MLVGGVNNKRQTLDEPDVFPYNPVCYNAIPNMFKERYDLHALIRPSEKYLFQLIHFNSNLDMAPVCLLYLGREWLRVEASTSR